MNPELGLEFIESASELAALREPWSTLLRASRSNHFFLSWEWQEAWWRHLGGTSELKIVTFKKEGQLVGIAPLCVRPTEIRAHPPNRRLELLGSGIAGSDYLDIVARPDMEDAVIDHLVAILSGIGYGLALKRVAEEGSIAGRLARRLEAHGWHAIEEVDEVCPYIHFSGLSWEDYLATRSRQHRETFRRKLRKLEKTGAVNFGWQRTAEAQQSCMNILYQLHASRWQGRGKSEAFCSDAQRSFHEEVGQRAYRHGWLRHYILCLGERPVSTIYGFRYDGKFLFFQSGLDAHGASLSAGLVAMGLAIRDQLESGAEEFDFLHGTERYKFHWATETRRLSRYLLYPPGLRGQLLAHGAALSRHTKAQARRLLRSLAARKAG